MEKSWETRLEKQRHSRARGSAELPERARLAGPFPSLSLGGLTCAMIGDEKKQAPRSGAAQGYSTRLACPRLWVPSPAPQSKNRKPKLKGHA